MGKLVILMMLLCVYTACWGPTEEKGTVDVYRHVYGAELSPEMIPNKTPAPLIVVVADPALYPNGPECFFWFFGYVIQLPRLHAG